MLPDSPDIHNKLLDQVAQPLADWASRMRTIAERQGERVRQMDDPVVFAARDSEPVALRKLKLLEEALWVCVRELDRTVERVAVIRDRLDRQILAIDGVFDVNSEPEQLMKADAPAQDEPKCTHQAPDSIN